MAKRKCNKLEGLPSRPPGDSSKVPFTQLCAWIFRSGTTFGVVDDELRVKMGDGAPTWLKGVIDAHAPKLLQLARCQAAESHIDARIRKLWATKDDDLVVRGTTYLYRKVAEFEALAGNSEGYFDPGNVFSDTAIACFREQLGKIGEA